MRRLRCGFVPAIVVLLISGCSNSIKDPYPHWESIEHESSKIGSIHKYYLLEGLLARNYESPCYSYDFMKRTTTQPISLSDALMSQEVQTSWLKSRQIEHAREVQISFIMSHIRAHLASHSLDSTTVLKTDCDGIDAVGGEMAHHLIEEYLNQLTLFAESNWISGENR